MQMVVIFLSSHCSMMARDVTILHFLTFRRKFSGQFKIIDQVSLLSSGIYRQIPFVFEHIAHTSYCYNSSRALPFSITVLQ
jgi:hypothetical protein